MDTSRVVRVNHHRRRKIYRQSLWDGVCRPRMAGPRTRSLVDVHWNSRLQTPSERIDHRNASFAAAARRYAKRRIPAYIAGDSITVNRFFKWGKDFSKNLYELPAARCRIMLDQQGRRSRRHRTQIGGYSGFAPKGGAIVVRQLSDNDAGILVGSLKRREGRACYEANAYTVEIGGQASLNDHLALVASIGSEHSNFSDNDTGTQITGNAAVGAVGLNYARGPWEFSGAVDGSYGWYTSLRTVIVGESAGTANAKPQEWQIGGHVHAGYSIPFSQGLYIKPFVDGHVIRVDSESFSEEGTSPFLLQVDARGQTTWLGAAGLELGTHFALASGSVLHPFISAAVESDSDSQWTTTARFLGQSATQSFAVQTAGPGTLGRFGAGLDLINSQHLSLSILYDPELGHGYTSQAGAAQVSYRF